jgi:hypothetical protein
MARLDGVPVLVVWNDAHAEHTWTSLEELGSEPYVVETVGWLIPDAKPDHVVIAQSIGCDDGMDSVHSIPVGMVRRTVILGNPPPSSTDSLP